MASQPAATGEADLVASFAYPLPTTVICDLLGIPAEARTDVRDWIGSLLAGCVGTFDTLALLTHPSQLAAVRAGPSRWPVTIEELPWFDSPAQVPLPTTTAEPVAIAGQTSPADIR